jgi:hypothetical protein
MENDSLQRLDSPTFRLRLATSRLRDLALFLEECQRPEYNTSRTSWLELAEGPVPRRLRESVR